jgi:S1-C subfamily serine protease
MKSYKQQIFTLLFAFLISSTVVFSQDIKQKLIPSKKTETVIILDEEFEDNSNNWNLVKSERFSQLIQSGKLIAESEMAGQGVDAFINVPYDYNNRDYDIIISIANLNAYGGVVFDDNGNKQYVENPYWSVFWGGDRKTRDYNAVAFYGYEKYDHQSTTYKVLSTIRGDGMEYETFASQYPTGLGPGDTFKRIRISKRGDKCYIYDKSVKKDGGLLAVIPTPECIGNNIGVLGEPGSKILVDYIRIKGESDYSYTRKFSKKGWNAVDNKNFEKAFYLFDKVIKSGFKTAMSYTDRAFARAYKGDFIKALSDIDTALAYNNNYKSAYFLRGFIKYRLDYEQKEIISDLKKGGKQGKEFINDIYPDYNNQNVTGSGIILSKEGYVATNYHVIKDSKEISVYISDKNKKKAFKSEVVLTDESNDLAILKIQEGDLNKLKNVPFKIKSTGVQVGENVYALGYPMINLQGTELKVTDGIISSKSGYKNDLSSYQVSVPIQPGNSGGPLFDKNGNLIGITSSKLSGGENVGYAIKGLFLQNMIDNIAELNILGNNDNSELKNKPMPKQIEMLRDYVVIISSDV